MIAIPSDDQPSTSYWLPRAAAICAMAIGAVVLVGWAFDLATLKSVLPGWGSMKANTALCFVLSGLAVYLAETEPLTPARRRLLRASAGIVSVVALLTLGEHLFDQNWGIDELLVRDRGVMVPPALPGRMAPLAAVCFLLTAIAALVLGRRTRSGRAESIVVGLGFVVTSLGAISMAGYIGDVALGFRWWNFPGMAVHTAAGFVLLGLGMGGSAARLHTARWVLERSTAAYFLIALALLLGVCVVTYTTLHSFSKTTSSVVHMHRVHSRIGDVKGAVGEAVAAQRAFLLTGREHFLSDSQTAIRRALQLLPELTGMVGDDPRQQLWVADLNRLMPTLAAGMNAGTTRAQQTQAARDGLAPYARSLRLFDALIAKQEEFLQERERQSRRDFDLALVFIPTGAFVSVLLLASALIAMNREAAERQRTGRALRKSEERFATTFRSSPAAIGIAALEDGRLLDVNEKFLALTGYSRDEAVGHSVAGLGLMRPEDVKQSVERLKTGGGSARDLEIPIRTKSGLERTVLFSLERIELDQGPCLLAILYDITARKEAEETLAAERTLLRTLIDLLPDYIYVKDALGRFLVCNDASARRLGAAQPRELIGRTDEDFFPPALAAQFRAEEMTVLAGSAVTNREEAFTRPDGVREIILTTKVPLRDSHGNIIGVVGTGRDITERKQSEAAIHQLNVELEQRVARRTAQLEAANNELEAFSYSVSHDLRAPLRAIDSYSQVIIEDLSPHLPPEGQRYLKTIRGETQRMGELIDDLLEFARLGRQTLRKQPVAPEHLVRAALADLATEQQGRQIEIRIGDLAPCRGDPALLKQVWLNLLANALKYTRKRERAIIEIGSRREGDMTTYYVRDNGTGFDMRYAEKLFGVFQRLHRAEDYEGTGVGLAIVQRVVQRHGGRVWAEASVDLGATFYFSLEGESNS